MYRRIENGCPKRLQNYGTWCTPELQKAVEKGYKIQKIHKVWHWGENQRKTGLFAPYVNRWLKHKTEACGWPAHCLTVDQKAAYIRDYKEHEGIQLEAKRTSVKLDKPMYTGFTVLELSKLHMYDFHYDHMMKKYGPKKAKLKTLNS